MRFLLALLLCLGASVTEAARPRATEVAVLVTLHALHAEVPAYSGSVLARSILQLSPDVLCVEVRADHLAQRAPEKNKVEYPGIIYPLIDAHRYRVYPMEPDPPRFDEIAGPYLAASRAFHETQPLAAAVLSAHSDSLYSALRTYWSTPARVNDTVTDQQMRAKHALQMAMIGEGERSGWEAWNRHFVTVIERAVAENPGRRIVVLVGAEHGYWLREALAQNPRIHLLDTAALLSNAGS